jgi:hypothetical protein
MALTESLLNMFLRSPCCCRFRTSKGTNIHIKFHEKQPVPSNVERAIFERKTKFPV